MDSPTSNPAFIHPTAIVEENVTLGSGVRIWHHCHIRRGAVIGDNTTLGKNCFIDTYVSIGKNCKIQNNVSVYHGVTLEDDVFVGPSVVFTNDPYPRAFVAWDASKALPTLIKKGASLGAGACIRCGITVESYGMIGMGSVLTKSTAPFELWMGNPAKLAGKVDMLGQRVESSN